MSRLDFFALPLNVILICNKLQQNLVGLSLEGFFISHLKLFWLHSALYSNFPSLCDLQILLLCTEYCRTVNVLSGSSFQDMLFPQKEGLSLHFFWNFWSFPVTVVIIIRQEKKRKKKKKEKKNKKKKRRKKKKHSTVPGYSMGRWQWTIVLFLTIPIKYIESLSSLKKMDSCDLSKLNSFKHIFKLRVVLKNVIGIFSTL